MQHPQFRLSFNVLATVICISVGSFATAFADQTMLTFDDLPASTYIQNGYGGLNWNNFYIVNGYDYVNNGGYWFGMVSPSNVAVNAYGNPAQLSSALPFDLDSAYLTAAWDEGLDIEVLGFTGSTLRYDNTYIVSTRSPSLINFDYLGVTQVNFISSGSGGAGPHFAMDNFLITIPEPVTTKLLLFFASLFAFTRYAARKMQ